MRTAVIVTPSAAITAAAAAKPNEIPVVGLPALLLFVPLVILLDVLLLELLELLLLVVPEEVLLDVVLVVVLPAVVLLVVLLPLVEVSLEVLPVVLLPLVEVLPAVPPVVLLPLVVVSPAVPPVVLSPGSEPVLPVMPFTILRPAFAASSTISLPALTAPFTALPIAEPPSFAEAADESAAKHTAAAAAAENLFNIVCSPLF